MSDDAKTPTGQAQAPESIREWWRSKTKNARRALLGATVLSTVVMALMWVLATTETIMRIQTFNGALTIPLWGGLWIFGFIFLFLVPTREATFRSTESFERMEVRLQRTTAKAEAAMDDEIVPAVKEFRAALKEVGTLREEALELKREALGLVRLVKEKHLKDLVSTIYVLQYASKAMVEKSEAAEKRVSAIADQAQPAIESLIRFEQKFSEVADGELMAKLELAADTMAFMAGGRDALNLGKARTKTKAAATASKPVVTPKTRVHPAPAPAPEPPAAVEEPAAVDEAAPAAQQVQEAASVDSGAAAASAPEPQRTSVSAEEVEALDEASQETGASLDRTLQLLRGASRRAKAPAPPEEPSKFQPESPQMTVRPTMVVKAQEIPSRTELAPSAAERS